MIDIYHHFLLFSFIEIKIDLNISFIKLIFLDTDAYCFYNFQNSSYNIINTLLNYPMGTHIIYRKDLIVSLIVGMLIRLAARAI